MNHALGAQMIFEAFLVGLEGADDEDTVRPQLLLNHMREGMPEVSFDFPEGLSVAEMREGARAAIERLSAPSCETCGSDDPAMNWACVYGEDSYIGAWGDEGAIRQGKEVNWYRCPDPFHTPEGEGG